MKVEVYIPDTLSEITLGQYQKYLKIQENNEDENFLAIKMIEIFCGLRGDTIMAMKANSIKDITLILTEMFNEKPQLVKEFKMGGRNYGFVPKLEDMTFGEYIDLDNYLPKWETMHNAMGVLYRPLKSKNGDKYTIEDYKLSEGIDTPLDVALSANFFLQNLLKDLLSYIPNSIKSIVQQELKSGTLDVNGDGINQSMESLKEICLDLRMSLN